MSAPVGSNLRLLTQHAEHVVRSSELEDLLAEERPLRVKLGVDPTAPSVTLGWAVPLRKLRQFQDAGHVAVLIIGDFTARVGDPSGKSQTRPQLTKEEVRDNAQACVAQLLDILSEENLEVRYNSEWLEGMDLTGVLELAAGYTVAQMLERDDFAKRYEAQQPISMIELLYPLLQGYDSLAVDADVELGGTDQLFNLLVARSVQRTRGQRPQIALTMPLLVGLDGAHKMSQSLGNYVGVRDTPADMFGKLMSIPDHLVAQYAALGAWWDEEAVTQLAAAVEAGGPEAGRAKRSVARAIVALYHGGDAAEAAEQAFDRAFRERRLPEEISNAAIPGEAVTGSNVYLPAVLAGLGLASSRSEARRLLAHGGVRVDGQLVTDEEIARADVEGRVLQVGKRRFVRLV